MTKLTTAQRDLLSLAAKAEDGTIDPGLTPPATISTLIKRGLILSVPRAGEPSFVLITQEGRSAIGKPTPSQPKTMSGPKRQAVNESTPAARPKGKVAMLVDILRQPDGASIEAMMIATGWQSHSVRGALSGAIKKNLGLEVTSEKTETGRIYSIPAELQA